jgi:hypothetical protein
MKDDLFGTTGAATSKTNSDARIFPLNGERPRNVHEDYMAKVCWCGRKKVPFFYFCVHCYNKLLMSERVELRSSCLAYIPIVARLRKHVRPLHAIPRRAE